jgi:predicted secreted hydrolase
VRIAGRQFDVKGLSWFDREWSTSALERDQVGWDWFSLQLEDGRSLMLYRLRRRDGGIDPFSGGTVTGPDGTSRTLAIDETKLDVLDTWRSPETGVRYPSRWRLRIPAEGVDVEIRPLLSDQELRETFRYWEGAVEVKGAGSSSAGYGYVELTGYGAEGGGKGG